MAGTTDVNDLGMERLRALEELEETLANFFAAHPVEERGNVWGREPILWSSQEGIDVATPGAIPTDQRVNPAVQGAILVAPSGEERDNAWGREPIIWPSQETIDARSPGAILPTRRPNPAVPGATLAASQGEERDTQPHVQDVDPWLGVESNPWMHVEVETAPCMQEAKETSESIEGNSAGT